MGVICRRTPNLEFLLLRGNFFYRIFEYSTGISCLKKSLLDEDQLLRGNHCITLLRITVLLSGTESF